MQIVIVSDHPDQVGSLQGLAADAGIDSIEGFTHPAAALDWCADHEPDLVLVDYMMRACDGLEFLRRFRAMPHLAEVPIVLMLAPGLGSIRAAAWQAGVTDFLDTPVDATEFAARSRNLLLLRAVTLAAADQAIQADLSLTQASDWRALPAGHWH
jgi:putative two-component system response regulator